VLAFAALGAAVPVSAAAAKGQSFDVDVSSIGRQELAVYDAAVDPSNAVQEILDSIADHYESTHRVYRSWLTDPPRDA
jgi:hypothetical protein